jgi:hypothetical protein
MKSNLLVRQLELKAITGTLTILASIFILNACRSKLEGRVAKGGKSAAISVADGATGPRQFFQTTSVVGIELNDKLIGLGDSFSIMNVTNNETVVPITLVDPALPTFSGEGFSYQVEGTGVNIKLYPKSAAMKGKLVYGINLLRVDVISAAGDKFWEWEITLRDFTIFGPTGSSFSDNVPSKGGFSGQFTGIVKPVVRAESGGVLRTGQFHMINH